MNSFWQEILKPEGKKIRILVFPFHLLSHYLRTLELAEQLRNDCELIFPESSRYEKWVKEKGYSTFSYTDFNAEAVIASSRRFDFSWLTEAALENVLAQQIQIIQSLQPDFVIGDASLSLKMAAEYCRVKYISVINGYMSKYYACQRPLPRMHPAYPYLRILPAAILGDITKWAERANMSSVHQPFKNLRRKYALKKQVILLDELEGDTTLIADVPGLFPQKDLPQSYRFIGPLFHRNLGEEKDVLAFINNGKKNILVSLGSTGDISLLTWLTDKLLSSYNIIIAHSESKVLQAGHIFSRPFIHNSSIMPYMDLVICHGGNGTLYQALSAGVPVLAVTSIFEQEYNMQRIKDLHLGDYITHSDQLEDKVRQLDEWISQKGNLPLSEIKSRISEMRKQFN